MSLLRRLRRPSPALLISVFALLVAAGVPAQAGLLISGKQIKNHSIRGVDVARSTITGSNVKNHSLKPIDFSGSVQGPAGSAIAFAHVRAAGVLDPLRTKSVVKVTRPSKGLYCFFGLPAVRNVVATVDRAGAGSGVSLSAALGTSGNGCAGVESASVRVLDSAGKSTDNGIWVSFN